MPKDSIAPRVPTHHECKDLAKEGKPQWTDVWRGCGEAHQKALSAAATLEEEIERLHRIRHLSSWK